jgi:hypothetical protein
MECKIMKQKLRLVCAAVIVDLSLSLAAVAQDGVSKPQVSKDPLTSEQMAVYRSVLQGYTNGSDSPLNVANKTAPMDTSGPFFDKACVRGLELENTRTSTEVVHQLDSSLALDRKFILVDPDQQEEKIKENDPQHLIKRAISGEEEVTTKKLDTAVTHAFETALFTLTEIIFDKRHRRAVVGYSFVCGGLCGHGNTLVLKKVGEKWRVSKTCGGWVS